MREDTKLNYFIFFALSLYITTISHNSVIINALSSLPVPLSGKEKFIADTNATKWEATIATRKAREPCSPEIKKNNKSYNPYPPTKFDIAQGFSAIAEKAILAVVNVSTTQFIEDGHFGGKEEIPPFPPGSPFEDFFRDFFDFQPRVRKVQSLGSGFIIQSDESSTIIVTNYHLIAEAKKIMVFLHDMTELKASILAIDEPTDIALLKVKTAQLPAHKRKLPTMEWADCNMAKVGDWVLAIGNPFGLGSTVTSGIISNRARNIMGRGRMGNYVDDFIQHDAALNLGNSGGPLINLEGKVIAINTAIYSPSGGSVGIGFGIPSSVAQDTVRQLLEFGRTKRGWLGIEFQPVTEAIAESLGIVGKARGDIVGRVTPGGPAAKAGIKPGDIILEFDGKEINSQASLPRLVGTTSPGKAVKIKVWRKEKEITLGLVLGESPTTMARETHPAAEKSKVSEDITKVLGIKVAALTPELKERFKLDKEAAGILVIKVDINSPAMEIGLKAGDIIAEVNQKTITKPKEFTQSVKDAKKAKHKNILLLVIRSSESFFMPLNLETKGLKDGNHPQAEERLNKEP